MFKGQIRSATVPPQLIMHLPNAKRFSVHVHVVFVVVVVAVVVVVLVVFRLLGH